MLLLAIVWFSRERLKPWLVYATLAVVAYSGLWTGYDEVARLAPYYPHFSLITLLGSADLFAVVGMMVPVALSIVALRKSQSPRILPQPVRRAAPSRRFMGKATGYRSRRPGSGSNAAASSSAKPAAPI